MDIVVFLEEERFFQDNLTAFSSLDVLSGIFIQSIFSLVKPFSALSDTRTVLHRITVLVSAGIEFISLVADTVLCFGFSVRIMLITH